MQPWEALAPLVFGISEKTRHKIVFETAPNEFVFEPIFCFSHDTIFFLLLKLQHQMLFLQYRIKENCTTFYQQDSFMITAVKRGSKIDKKTSCQCNLHHIRIFPNIHNYNSTYKLIQIVPILKHYFIRSFLQLHRLFRMQSVR